MANQSTLSIRISADATQATSVIQGATQSLNGLNQSAIAGATSLQRFNTQFQSTGSAASGITTGVNNATASINRMTGAMSQSAQSSARWTQELNNSTRAAQQAASANEQLHRSNTAASGSFNLLKSSIGGIGLAFLARDLLKVNIEMEMLRARLDAASSSLASSKAAFSIILQIAKDTPQSISEITKAFTMLKNFGIDPTEKTMRGFTDVTSKLGGASDTLTGIIRAFGQANGKAALHAQDANQMIERGVPVYGLLVKVVGKSTAEIMKMMEAGELGRDTMEKLRQELFKWADGSSEKMMNTLGGRIEGLSSAWSHFQDVLMGDKSEGALKSVVKNWTETIELLTGMMETSTSKKIVELQESIKAHDNQPWIAKQISLSLGYNRADKLKEIEQLRKEEMQSFLDARKDKKIVQDQTEGERIQAEIATNKAIANGDSDALKKFMSAKLGAINEVTRAHVAAEAERVGISTKAALAIMAVESTGKVGALNKSSGAAGLMQVMPANYKAQGFTENQMLTDEAISIRAGLKVYVDSINEAKKEAAKGAIEISQIPEYALALYSTKHQAIKDRIKKNGGVFDMNLMPTATQDENNKVNAAYAILNTKENELFDSIKHSVSESVKEKKHLATESENTARKIADSDRQLTENTAIGKYNATIDDLTQHLARAVASHKDVDKAQYTYSQGIENANETLLKNTDYVVENAKALKEQAREYEKMLGHVSDYNATIIELQSSLATKDISKEQFSVGVTSANAKMMNGVTGTNIPATAVGEHQSAVAAEKLANKSEQLTKSYENEVEALEKIRREIEFGDRAAYESTQRHKGFTDEKIADLMRLYDSVQSTKIIDDLGLSTRKLAGTFTSMFQQIAVQGKSFAETLRNTVGSAISSISSGLMNMGFASGNPFAIAGGMAVGLLSSLMPKEKTIDTHTETKLTDSNTLQNVITTLNSIHAKEYKELQGINDGFTMMSKGVDNTISRAIAWNGGFTPSTNGMKTTDNGANGKQFIAGLGTTAVSAGLAAAGVGTSLASTAVAAAINASVAVTGASSALTGALVSTSASLAAGGLAAAAAMGGIGLLVGGAIYGLGKILGIGKTKFTAIGSGLVTEPAKLIDVAAGKALEAYDYSTVKAKTKGWFSDKTKIFDVINGYNAGMSDAFSQVFTGLYDGLYSAIKDFGITSSSVDFNLQNAVIPMMKTPNLTGKTDAEIGDIMTKMVNTMTDKMAHSVMGGLIDPFAKAGEATVETLMRLTTQIAVVKGSFHKIGIDIEATGMGAVVFADSINTVFESSINAKDGMKQFSSAINDFYNSVLTKGEKTAFTISDYKSFTAENPQLGLSSNPSMVSGSQMMSALQAATKASESASIAAGAIAARGQDVKNALAPETSNELKTLLTQGAWSDKISGNYENMTPSSFKEGWWDIVQTRASTSGQEHQDLYKEMVSVATSNQAKQSQGQAAIAGTGITSIAQQEAATAGAIAEATKKAEDLKKVVSMAGVFSTIVNDFQEKYKNLDEFILSKVTSESETLTRAHAKELEQLRIAETDSKTGAKTYIVASQLDEKTRKLYAKFMNTTVEAQDKIGYLTSDLQKLAWSFEETTKSTAKLKDAGKYLTDFTHTILNWVKNLKATSIGTPTSQLAAAKSNLDEQLGVIKNSVSAEEKRTALSGITGLADTYMTAIKNYYGSSKEGQELLQSVVNSISELPASVDIQSLQLGVLEQIKDGTFKLDPQLSKIAEILATDKAVYDANPTTSNALKLDADAKIALSMQNFIVSGADKVFVDKMIEAVTSKGGVLDAISVTINSDLDATQAETSLNSLTNQFNAATFDFKTFSFDIVAAQAVADTAVAALVINPVYFTANADNLNTTVLNITQKGTPLDGLNGKTFNSIIDVTDNASTPFKNAYDKAVAFVNGNAAYVAKMGIDGYDDAELKLKAVYDSAVQVKGDYEAVLNATDSTGTTITDLQASISDFVGDATGWIAYLNADDSAILTNDVIATRTDSLIGYTNSDNEWIASLGANDAGIGGTITDQTLIAGEFGKDWLAVLNADSKAIGNTITSQTEDAGKFAKGTYWTAYLKADSEKADGIISTSTAAAQAFDLISTEAKIGLDTGVADITISTLGSIKTSADNALKSIKDLADYQNAGGKVDIGGGAITAPAANDAGSVAANDAGSSGVITSPVTNRFESAKKPNGYYSATEDQKKRVIESMNAQGMGRNDFKNDTIELLVNESTGMIVGARDVKHQSDPWATINPKIPFANGGAFTNGIVDKPTSFNMGLMGEDGSEAIMPLHNIGGSLGVRAIMPASNDSSSDNGETIAELKESNRKLTSAITVLQSGFTQLLNENKKQTDALETLQSVSRMKARA